MQVKLPHVKGLSIVLPVIYILWVAVMYYLLLPALNIHSRGLLAREALWLCIMLKFPKSGIIRAEAIPFVGDHAKIFVNSITLDEKYESLAV